MSGTSEGGKLAAKTNKQKWGEKFYAEIGKRGGMVRGRKGFAVSGLAAEAGRKGGAISRRRSK
jgi:general stress protein YciG